MYLFNAAILCHFLLNRWHSDYDDILGNMITVLSPEGKPIQVNASALQAAGAQNNAVGMINVLKGNHLIFLNKIYYKK